METLIVPVMIRSTRHLTITIDSHLCIISRSNQIISTTPQDTLELQHKLLPHQQINISMAITLHHIPLHMFLALVISSIQHLTWGHNLSHTNPHLHVVMLSRDFSQVQVQGYCHSKQLVGIIQLLVQVVWQISEYSVFSGIVWRSKRQG